MFLPLAQIPRLFHFQNRNCFTNVTLSKDLCSLLFATTSAILNKINGAKMIQLPKMEKREKREFFFVGEQVARARRQILWLKFLDVFIGGVQGVGVTHTCEMRGCGWET